MIAWRKWLRWGAVGAGVLMATVAVGGFFLPASLIVERERLMPLPAPELYDRVSSLRRWPEWATWWQREPFLQVEHAGPETGAGGMMAWRSKAEGEGRAKITAVSPSREVALAFDFGERGDAVSAIRFEESADRTHTLVKWKFRTDFGGNTGRRYFGLMFRKWVEKDIEDSLAGLEAAALAKSTPLPESKIPVISPQADPAAPPQFPAPTPSSPVIPPVEPAPAR
ncbi:MAG: hypothetical protein JWL81_1507 [Verrucomicrobiales bacterium]|nr:hypothetical protein [Verrucomicrobiales bacterium]